MMAYDLYEVGEISTVLNYFDKNVNWIHDVLKYAKYKKRKQTMGFAESLERKWCKIYIKLTVLGEKLTRSQYCAI